MVLLRRKAVLAAAIETTPGTAETLANGDASFICYDPLIQPNLVEQERPEYGGFNFHPSSIGPRSGTATFRTDLHGDGAGGVPAWASTFLPACGYVNSLGTFSPTAEPVGSNVKTLTIGLYQDGRRHILTGCCGTFRMLFPTGRPAQIEWTFTGKWGGVSDQEILSPTYPTQMPLRYANGAFTIGSYSPCVESVSVEAGNNVILRECVSASDATGFAAAEITDRRSVVSANPEAGLVSDDDTYGDWLAANTYGLMIQVFDSSDQVDVEATDVQTINAQQGERNGMVTDDLQMLCTSGFTISFS